MSSSKETKKHHTSALLTDESKNVLLGYHKIQMKRDQLINPAESGSFLNNQIFITHLF